MEKQWVYKNLDVKEGLKPGSSNFQYFFVVSDGGEKKCNYCVWVEDEALSRFDQFSKFESIASSNREDWSKWVKDKIDQGDFRNLVLKFSKEGQTELDLAEMEDKLTMG
jgi:hypothetical protein